MNVTGQFDRRRHEYGYDVTIVVGGNEHHLADLKTSDGVDENDLPKGVNLLEAPSRSATPPICCPR